MTVPRRIILACVIAGGLVVAYLLISPLFVTRRVAEELPLSSAGATVPTAVPTPEPTESVVTPPTTAENPFSVGPPTTPTPATPTELARGTFEGLAGHRAQGTARVIEVSGKRYVRFESDFRVTNGPDLFVYLGRNGAYDPNARLSALKGNEGSQNYELPTGDLSAYDAVWVWCRAFSVPFGKAVFTPA
ncbi:MAG: DM13 domain-containing protein [bacterium]|nr:DM13 domain-containing protein [bacterium]